MLLLCSQRNATQNSEASNATSSWVPEKRTATIHGHCDMGFEHAMSRWTNSPD